MNGVNQQDVERNRENQDYRQSDEFAGNERQTAQQLENFRYRQNIAGSRQTVEKGFRVSRQIFGRRRDIKKISNR
jgi:hypothetical protein